MSSVEERRMYDWSLARIGETDTYTWPFEADITQIQTQLPPPRVRYSPFAILFSNLTGKNENIVDFGNAGTGRRRSDEIGGLLLLGLVRLVHRLIDCSESVENAINGVSKL